MVDYYEKLDKAKAVFLREASRHSIEVKLDNGTFRHLRFSQNNSSTYHFNITTWPGYLSLSGDMGCFVFARTTDMFEFFRGDRINPQYWAEKLQATSRGSGHEAFSFELLKEAVAADFENWDFESDEQKAEAWEKIAGDYGLLYDADGSDLQYAVGEVMDYECPVTKQKFEDFWDHNFHDYTHHFMWCCNAIQWGIQQYDLMKVADTPKDQTTAPPFAVPLDPAPDAIARLKTWLSRKGFEFSEAQAEEAFWYTFTGESMMPVPLYVSPECQMTSGDEGLWHFWNEKARVQAIEIDRLRAIALDLQKQYAVVSDALSKIAAETTIGEPFKSENRILQRDDMVAIARAALSSTTEDPDRG